MAALSGLTTTIPCPRCRQQFDVRLPHPPAEVVMPLCLNCDESPHEHARTETRCLGCGQRVYRVETAMDERFLVGSYTGTRWCR